MKAIPVWKSAGDDQNTAGIFSVLGCQPHGLPANCHMDLINTAAHAVAQLVKALRYNLEGCVFDSRCCHCNFLLTYPSGHTMALGLTQSLTEMSTVIPRLMKIIRSAITFVSQNTHTDGKDKLLEWPDH